MTERRALVVAIPDCGDSYDPLDDLVPAAADVATQLSRLEYDVRGPDDTRYWKSKQVGKAVSRLLKKAHQEDVCVVHVLSHGKHAGGASDRGGSGSYYVLGSDGVTDSGSLVELWLKDVQHSQGRPLTLFILDTCFSGQAAQVLSDVDEEDLRGWVLAASTPGGAAYDALLSKAVANTLRLAAEGGLGITHDVEYIPWVTFRDRVISDVERERPGSFGQRVTPTKTARTVDPPFFRNLGYRPQRDGLSRLKTIADPALGAILDAFDRDHFIDRARGRRGPAERRPLFTGRESQLAELTQWLTADDPSDSVRVVTGSPGSGKSALIGVIVCATHPQLRTDTDGVWSRAAHVPTGTWPTFAAVHARSRTVTALLSSLGDQLGLRIPEDGWSTPTLVDALRTLSPRPVIVVDALDEADNVPAVLTFLKTLAVATNGSGTPTCRLIIGTRSGDLWQDISTWTAGLAEHQVLDLDATPADVLRQDLATYLTHMLGPSQTARDVARRVAAALTEPRPPRTAETPERTWGEFLVAALFGHTLLDRGIPRSDEEVRAVLAEIPRTLPQVLELDLRGRPDEAWRRSVLHCLAWAKGEGMPLRLVQVLTRTAFAPRTLGDLPPRTRTRPSLPRSRGSGSTSDPRPTSTRPRCIGCSTRGSPKSFAAGGRTLPALSWRPCSQTGPAWATGPDGRTPSRISCATRLTTPWTPTTPASS